jgi:hypothetical protein
VSLVYLVNWHRNSEPDAGNGWREASDLMNDKLMAVMRSKLGKKIGAIYAEEMERVEDAMMPGFAG